MPNGTYVELFLTVQSESILRTNLAAMKLPLSSHPYHCTTVFSKLPIEYPGIASRYEGEEQPPRLWSIHPNTMNLMFLGGNLVLGTRNLGTALSHKLGEMAGATWDFPEYIPHITLVDNIDCTQLEGQTLWTPRKPLVFAGENVLEINAEGKVARE